MQAACTLLLLAAPGGQAVGAAQRSGYCTHRPRESVESEADKALSIRHVHRPEGEEVGYKCEKLGERLVDVVGLMIE